MASKKAAKESQIPTDFKSFQAFEAYVKNNIGEASTEVIRAWWDSWPSEKPVSKKTDGGKTAQETK